MARSRVELKDLINAGLLQVGEELTCLSSPERVSHKANLKADGSIIDDSGKKFGSVSGWASALARGINNRRDGWKYVTARGQKLDFYREQLNSAAESQPSTDFENAVSEGDAVSEPVHQDEPSEILSPRAIEPSDVYPEVNGLQVELESLKSQLSSQQLAISTLNAKIENLPISRSEDDPEDSITKYLRERVLKLEPGEFEVLVGEYLKSKGFSNVVVSGRSGDGGIDGECGIPFINVKVAFQAKRYTAANSIGIEPVQRLQGSMTGRFDRGIFITTSDYTSAARGWVEEVQAQITLINGDELMKEMIDLGLGVKAVTVVKHEVDENFFTDLENTR